MVETEHLRADARRNREKLLAVAADAFATSGVDSSLEAIARQAGVGVGTLYRHFPTRDALIAATYRREVDQLCSLAGELHQTMAADIALRTWMDGFVRYAATKRGMGEALREVMASNSELFSETRTRLIDSIDSLVDAGIAAGSIREDATGLDVLSLLGAVFMVREGPEHDAQTTRILDLVTDGLRPQRPSTS